MNILSVLKYTSFCLKAFDLGLIECYLVGELNCCTSFLILKEERILSIFKVCILEKNSKLTFYFF